MSTEKTGTASVSATPFDTTAEAHARQSEIYRRLGGRERLRIMFRLNATVGRLTKAGIRTRHPDYGDDEVQRAYCRLQLGDEAVCAIWPGRELVEP